MLLIKVEFLVDFLLLPLDTKLRATLRIQIRIFSVVCGGGGVVGVVVVGSYTDPLVRSRGLIDLRVYIF
jgi:hypothetical protein